MKIPKTLETKDYKVKKGLNGLGLFAENVIPKKSWIIEYIGERKTAKQVALLETQYLFEVTKKITIDGSPRYNTARYINYACEPNAEAWNVDDRIFIRAIKDIEKGEEITYNYGKEFFDRFIKPKGCHCRKCMPKTKKLQKK